MWCKWILHKKKKLQKQNLQEEVAGDYLTQFGFVDL